MGEVTIDQAEYRALLSSAARTLALKDYIRSHLKDGFIERNSVMAIIGMGSVDDGGSNDA